MSSHLGVSSVSSILKHLSLAFSNILSTLSTLSISFPEYQRYVECRGGRRVEREAESGHFA